MLDLLYFVCMTIGLVYFWAVFVLNLLIFFANSSNDDTLNAKFPMISVNFVKKLLKILSFAMFFSRFS